MHLVSTYDTFLDRRAPLRLRQLSLNGLAAGLGLAVVDLLTQRGGGTAPWRLALLVLPVMALLWASHARGRALAVGGLLIALCFGAGNEYLFYRQGLAGSAQHAFYFVIELLAGLSLLPVRARGRRVYLAGVVVTHLAFDWTLSPLAPAQRLAFDGVALCVIASMYFILEAHFRGHRRQFELRAEVTRALEALDGSRTKVVHATGTLAASTRDLSGNTHSLRGQADELRGAVEQIAEASARLARSAGALSAQARTSAAESDEARRHTGDIDRLVGALRQGMDAVEGAVGSTAASVRRLQDSSHRALSFVEVLRDLSTETHVLALNAGLEAARAGEHGRGFAVVAREVRRLAAESGRRAADVGALVQEMAAQMAESSAATEHIALTVTRFTPLLETARGTLSAIQGLVDRHHAAFTQTAAEADRQAEDTGGISEAGARLRMLVDAHAGVSADVAATADRLAQLSGALQGLLPTQAVRQEPRLEK